MPRIPPEVVQDIRERTDIASVVSRHVQLQRRGSRFVGLCPFHQEKTPSFHVIPEKSMFYCFGCQKGGDAFKFLMEIEGLGFVEAVKELAGQAGVEIPERELTQDERRKLRARATMLEVLEAACQVFENALMTSQEGERGRQYLRDRGMTEDTIRSARLGFAPESWSFLTDALSQQGFPQRLLVDAGLAKAKERGRPYDAFRNRLIIPIRDKRKRVIAFGGRDLGNDPRSGKYINSEESPLYKKSSVLYGIETAGNVIRKRGRVIIVEGYFDVLSLQQAGFGEAVAACGTALTKDHVLQIRRLTRQAVVLLDADEAGARAAERALPMFSAAGVEAWRLQLPDAKDPDELIQAGGPEAMESALQLRVPLLEWVARRKLGQYGHSAAGKERTLEELLEVLTEPSPAQLSELAAILRLQEKFVLDRARTISARPPEIAPPADMPPDPMYEPPAPQWRPHRDVVHLLWLMVHRYEEVADLMMRVDPRVLDAHAAVRPALARLTLREPVTNIIDDETDRGVKKTLVAVVARERLYTRDEAALALCDILARLTKPLHEAEMAFQTDQFLHANRRGEPEAARLALAARMRIKQLELGIQQALQAGEIEELILLLEPAEPVDGPEE